MKIVSDGIIFDMGDFRLKRSEVIKVQMIPCVCPCNMVVVTSARGLSGRTKGMIHQQYIGGPVRVLVPPMYVPLA